MVYLVLRMGAPPDIASCRNAMKFGKVTRKVFAKLQQERLKDDAILERSGALAVQGDSER